MLRIARTDNLCGLPYAVLQKARAAKALISCGGAALRPAVQSPVKTVRIIPRSQGWSSNSGTPWTFGIQESRRLVQSWRAGRPSASFSVNEPRRSEYVCGLLDAQE